MRHGAAWPPVPASAGIGLKPAHFTELIQRRPAVGFLELHPENYMVPGGPMLRNLHSLRELYPLSFHSVGSSPGSAGGIDEAHVRRIRELADRFEPAFVSDHLSWNQWRQYAVNDLLPLPYTQDALRHVCRNVGRMQDILGRPIAIENPSSYVELKGCDMDEVQFLVELVKISGASILLDINNLYVSACNRGWSPADYLSAIPRGLVSEFHLAGHQCEALPDGRTLRIDDHGSRVCDEVWRLYDLALERFGPIPTLIEWDTNIPELAVLLQEAELAGEHLQQMSGERLHV